MAEPFMSEIRIFSFGFPPKGWAQCDGQLLPINQNQALFSLLGTTFGGNGQTTFALPDMRSRVPIHGGNGHTLGERGGEAAHTLTINELPTHVHIANASTLDADSAPVAGLLGGWNNGYRGFTNPVALQASAVASVGGSQAHPNQQPFLVLNFSIALQGIFPSPN
jgi:microcystin-dependent protein